MFRAALFDLDGVVFDTESQYSVFWGDVCRKYHPELPGLENKIKGQTLVQIFDAYFNGMDEAKKDIVARLDEYESRMTYDYVPGFETFVSDLKANGVLTALVTSSNNAKMQSVYRSRPELLDTFNLILTSENFSESKPAPDCYLQAARELHVKTSECLVFEDSFNGLKSGTSARMRVVGLSTTNPADVIAPLCQLVIADFSHFSHQLCLNLF